ncbi:MurR/RpiR family transcriptional regulator [Clostridium intestinale]|jgi:DNA-binding MurR/RpiR family transcriptional regulator|uniref:MurR/RpiR family transcriptional regulator n=1 Tax=Clostridium intestinale TaxID=36845 RepID=A0A7D7A4N2_9CLOT|nr:MurR/RpiR family transcriptional regulator [Clostridium intestinale]QLY80480.1 MurR/RpiR family transcriptional regulator [Clostridium intestinale]
MGFHVRMKQYSEDFTQSEQKISEYILKNQEEVVNLSAQELGEKTGTSPASIVRFSRKLGFSGFGELKIEIAKTTNSEEEELDTIISPKDSVSDIAEKVVNRAVTSLKETYSLINIKDLEESINLMREAETIYLFGIGASSLVAMDLMYKLVRINKRVIFNIDSHLQLAAVVHITNKDVAIGISYSGKTREVNEGIIRAKEKGAKVISITNCNKNPLSSISDISLNIPNEERQLRFGAISSRMDQLALIDILFLGVAIGNFDKIEDMLMETKEIVKKLK